MSLCKNVGGRLSTRIPWIGGELKRKYIFLLPSMYLKRCCTLSGRRVVFLSLERSSSLPARAIFYDDMIMEPFELFDTTCI